MLLQICTVAMALNQYANIVVEYLGVIWIIPSFIFFLLPE
jgi:hypothetical protein